MRELGGIALLQECEESDGLYGLSQSHLVCKHTIEFLAMQEVEPIESLCLVSFVGGREKERKSARA